MTKPTKRGRGRPPLSEEEALSTRRMVRLPVELDRQAEAAKGDLPWSEWLRGLIEAAVGRPTRPPPD